MVVACIALAVAIGGTSYAIQRLPARSVGATQIKSNAVTGAKVRNDSLNAADIRESSLEGVIATGLAGVSIKTAAGLIPAAPSIDQSGVATASVPCDPGQQAIAGGGRLEVPERGEISDSFPDAGGAAWTVHAANGDLNSAHGFTVFAMCVARGASEGR
jgi:hypothetical protein